MFQLTTLQWEWTIVTQNFVARSFLQDHCIQLMCTNVYVNSGLYKHLGLHGKLILKASCVWKSNLLNTTFHRLL